MKIIPFWLLLVLTLTGLLQPASVQAANEVGPGKKYFLVYDYQNDWLVYNASYQNYVPYTRSLHDNDLSVSVLVDLLKNRRYTLLIQTQEQNYLFVEGAMQKRIKAAQWLELNIDSLYRTYRKDEIMLTLYGSTGTDSRKVLVANPVASAPLVLDKAAPSLINIKPIPTNPFRDFSVLIMLLLLVLNVLTFLVSTAIFSRFVNPAELFENDDRSDNKSIKPYNLSMLLLTALVALVQGYLLMVLHNNGLDLFSSGVVLTGGGSLPDHFLHLGKISLVIFLLIYLKYLFMVMVAGMLNLDKIVNVHYFKSLQASYLFFGVSAIALFSYSLYFPMMSLPLETQLLAPFIGFYLLKFIFLYILIKPGGSVINLYLFSYLCVIEIIPLIIGVKFAL
jgi:hypothetical protein